MVIRCLYSSTIVKWKVKTKNELESHTEAIVRIIRIEVAAIIDVERIRGISKNYPK